MTSAAPGTAHSKGTEAPAADVILTVSGLQKSFGGVHAVRDCSFKAAAGTITGLIGPNGAGKTTAFNLITGVLRPTAGHVTFRGTDLSGLPAHRVSAAGIGRTFQVTRVFEDMTVLDNVVIHASKGAMRAFLSPRVTHAERQRALSLLDFLGLTRLAYEPAGSLSYGQRKLLELAGVLMAEPTMIMLDEPAGGVNPRLLDEIIEHIRELNKSGVTFLIVEHNMDLVMSLCDSVVVMADGQVMRQGSPREIQADDEVLSAYLGEAVGGAQ
jgi:branched-chain amino acid transport system ATP-binding protein